MILPNMNAHEMLTHIATDMNSDNMKAWISGRYKDFFKVMKKRPPKLAYRHTFIRTTKDTHQEYLFFFSHKAGTNGEFYDSMVYITILRCYKYVYYILPQMKPNESVVMISSHALQRWMKRTNRFYTNDMEALWHFQSYNYCGVALYMDDRENPKKIVYAFSDGLMLADVPMSDKIICRTFVSADMLKGTQQEAFDKIIAYVEKSADEMKLRRSQKESYEDIHRDLCQKDKEVFLLCTQIYAKYFEEDNSVNNLHPIR